MTEKLGPPPVERLSDVAWARVERNVFSRLAEGTVTSAAASREGRTSERTTNKWLWLAVPGAAAAAFALAFFSMNGPSSQQAATTTHDPSRVVTGAAPSSVSYGDTHVTLDANSAVVMDDTAGKPSALLENGAAVFAVPPRTGAPFTVLAGDASIRATNSKFRVAREGERASVTVETGSVGIRFRGHEVHVSAKHTWSSDRPEAQ